MAPPSFIALAPDGMTAYFTDDSNNTVNQLLGVDTASPIIGAVISNPSFNFTGANLFPQIAIAPQLGYPQPLFNDIFAYVTNTGNAIDATAVSSLEITRADNPFVNCQNPFTAGIGPNGMAVIPDGRKGYVCNTSTSNEVTTISDLPSCSATSMNVEIEGTLTDPSITPDQAPLAHFSVSPSLALINQPVLFDASSSVAPVLPIDSSSGIFNYMWDFGDGSTFSTQDMMTTHSYILPGIYPISLTVTIIGGSSTHPSTYFNGQFLLRNGEMIGSGLSAQYQLSVTIVGTGNLSMTTIVSSSNPSTVGDPVTFTSTVTGNAGFTPTGTVEFFDNNLNFLGTGTLVASSSTTATTSITTSMLSTGTHVISARYSGDSVYMASAAALTQQVNRIPTTTTIISNTPDPSIFGQTVAFVANVATSAGTLNGTVNFVDVTNMKIIGSVALNTATNNATLLYSGLNVGSHQIEAMYIPSPLFDLNHLGSTSAPVTQIVNPANTTTTVVTSGTPSIFGKPVTFTATVSIVPPGSGSVVGDFVAFYDNSTFIGTAQINDVNQAEFTTIMPLTVGIHSITAVFNDSHGSVDPNFNSSSGNVIQQVIPDTTTTTLTSSLNPAVVGQTVTFTATVAANTTSSGEVTGFVTFIIDGETVGTVPVMNGQANFKTSTLTLGDHTVVAVYSGDMNHLSSTSETLVEMIVSVAPPRDLKVIQVINKFASQEDRINIITWKTPHMGEVPVAYKIYRNAKLTKKIATVRASQHSSSHSNKFKFEDHNRRKKRNYVYYIVSIDQFGNVSTPAKVVLRVGNSSHSESSSGSSSRSN